MRWLKQFVNILFVFCVLVIIKCSSTKRVEKNSGRLKNNLNSLGATQHHDRRKRVKTNSLVNTEAERLKHESGKQRLHSSHVSITSNSRRHDNEFRLVIIPQRQRLRSKTRDKSDGTKSQGTNNRFSKTATIKYPEIIVTRKDGAKKATLQSRYISNKWLSKLDKTKDKTIGIEANFNGFLNKRKRGYNKMVSSHRISKRNVNTSLPTQPNVTPTTELPILIPPLRLPTLPPAPQYNIPPVNNGQKSCSGRCTGNVTAWRTDERLACHCDTACYHEIFNDCCTDYTKYCGLQKPGEIPINIIEWMFCNLRKSDIPTCQSEESCKGRCSNDTEWRNEIKMRCSCDPDCYEVFNDCCSDYTKYCGAQKPAETLTMKYNYTCEDVGHWDDERCTIGDGLWMVARCRPDWPHDTFRTKCEAPVDKLTMSSQDLYGYLPVLGHDNTTFRNMYCAICNGVQKNEPWPLDIQITGTPPEMCNLTEKIRFLLSYEAEFPDGKGPWRPGTNQARRYCMKEIIDSCSPLCKKALSCNNGDVALISAGGWHFKNTHCAACHGLPGEIFCCFPDGLHKHCSSAIVIPQPLSRVLESGQTVRDNEALGYITFVFYILSILFLIFLLLTYILFHQLRTLPGKNLMNLATSLLLFEIFWLPSSFSEVREDKPTCMAMAIMEHYFLMASFASMTVIAFHTCKVFARNLPAPKISEGHERKLFCTYFALVWLVPAVFVAICVLLDHKGVVKIGYGESEICWLTENNAYTYFIAIPIALQLLFNIIAFVITAVYIRKHGQNQAARQASGNKRSNLSIFVKLSTLMGFTWLFGLLALVVTSTNVFWYFFVISTSLQGVFVVVAFVMNAKTFNMYKQGYKTFKNDSSYVPIPPNPLRRNVATNVATIYYDTKL